MSTSARRSALIGGTVLAILLLCALFADRIAPYDPSERVGRPFGRPSGEHWLGTDDVGHDLLSVLIHGARISLLVGLVAAFAATVIGAAVGVVAGYSRGWVDTMLMRIVDVVLSMPVLPLTIVIGVFAGPGLTTQMTVIAGVLWAGTARELRSQVLSLRERDYLQALRAMGAGQFYTLRRHVLPAVFPLIVPQFVIATKTAIMLEASLSFLGLGDITAPSWGAMLSLAHSRSAFLTDAWMWWVLPPGVAIAATVLGFALLGNALEERSRPVLRRRKATGSPRKAEASPTRADGSASEPPLVIEGLTISYGKSTPAVSGVDLTVAAGELVGLVGESGSGKSTVAAAAMALLPGAAEITAGSVRVCGEDLSTLTAEGKRVLRGSRIALIPQEAMSALNPVYTIGSQLAEMIRHHSDTGRTGARIRAGELLEAVGIDAGRIGAYPHELSGGMRQRVVIAMALANEPAVLIADEPTSGLDVLVEGEILDLLDRLRADLGLALLVVSHDLPVIERVADRIAVMQGGDLVEVGSTIDVISSPRHPYTRTLVDSIVRLDAAVLEGAS